MCEVVKGGGGAGNEGVDGTRSEDDTTVLDRGFVLSFLCNGFDLMGFNSMGGAGAVLMNRSSEGDSTNDLSWVFICVASPPAFLQDFPHREQTNWDIYAQTEFLKIL